MRRILVAVDGSPASSDAVALAVQSAVEHDLEIDFVHVVPLTETAGWYIDDDGAELPLHEPDERELAVLDAAAAVAAENGVAATTTMLRGAVASEIVSYAESSAADVIVVGSRGHGAAASTLLGSVSLGVLRGSRRPVLIVHGARRMVRTRRAHRAGARS